VPALRQLCLVEKNPHTGLNEVLAGSSDKKVNRQISTWLKKGLIRKIAPRLYSPNFTDPPGDIIRRNLFEVLSLLYPGALRKPTRRALIDPYLRMLERIYNFSLTVSGEDMNLMQDYLETCNAFQEPTEASLQF